MRIIQTTPQEMVRQFHDTFGAVSQDVPGWPDTDTVRLRIGLLLEEFTELADACGHAYLARKLTELAADPAAFSSMPADRLEPADFAEAVDALADMQYVLSGAAIAFGVDLDAVTRLVHEANMSKLWTGADVAAYARQAQAEPVEPLDFTDVDGAFIATRISDGKVIKPPSFQSPNVAGWIKARQGREESE